MGEITRGSGEGMGMRSQATDIGAVPAPARRDPQFDLSYGNKEIILCAGQWRRELALMGRPAPLASARRDASLARRGSDFRSERGARAKLMTGPAQGVVQNEPAASKPCAISGRAIVLERNIAEHGGFPAIDTHKSLSRMLPLQCVGRTNTCGARAHSTEAWLRKSRSALTKLARIVK